MHLALPTSPSPLQKLLHTSLCISPIPRNSHRMFSCGITRNYNPIRQLRNIPRLPYLTRPVRTIRPQLTAPTMLRTEPNIIITGTPGVGKTTHCEELASKTGLHHLNINEIVKKHNIGEKSDDPEDPNTKLVDEDRLLDVIENDLEEGGQIIDWHACDLFPPSLIDLVCVIRCDNKTLYDRLRARKYGEKKLQENLDCEIMEVLLQEARDAYDEQIVVELHSEQTADIDSNVERIAQWIDNWKKDHGKGGDQSVSTQQEQRDEDNPLFLHG